MPKEWQIICRYGSGKIEHDFLKKNMILLQRYSVVRNFLVTTIQIGFTMYFLMTDQMEGSSIEGKEFISCGPNFCSRSYKGANKLRHYKASMIFNVFMIAVSCLPMFLEVINETIMSLLSTLVMSWAYIIYFILGNEIVTDTTIMGKDTHCYHKTARFILWLPMLFPIVLVTIELLTFTLMLRKRD